MTNQIAFTETHVSQPGYINITDHGDGSVTVSVRTRTASAVSTITMAKHQAEELFCEAALKLAGLKPPEVVGGGKSISVGAMHVDVTVDVQSAKAKASK